MRRPGEEENSDYWDGHSPKRKIELIDERLAIGNNLAGSRHISAIIPR